tara:strand:+ start:443 stop:616 length:174 start_codon:yes stop_codon:yes gene_type:complete
MPTVTDEQIAKILHAAGPRADEIRIILGEDLEPVVEEEKAEEKEEESSEKEEADSEE